MARWDVGAGLLPLLHGFVSRANARTTKDKKEYLFRPPTGRGLSGVRADSLA